MGSFKAFILIGRDNFRVDELSGAKTDIITLVRQKKARFDSKMHGSTEKSPVRQKNARFDRKMPSPECIS